MLLAGLALGLVGGVGYAVFRTYTDTTIKDVDELRDLVDAPNLAAVEHLGNNASFADGLRDSDVSETFRQMRTNLQFVDVDHKPKVIALTSALPAEGKSTTAASLAVALGLGGFKTILDRRRLEAPARGRILRFPGLGGVNSILAGHLNPEAAIQARRGSKVSVLTSGPIPPNPSELLGSNQMVQLLARLRDLFDMVIIDAPPVLPVADAVALAHNCDGVILACKYGSTTRQQFRQAADSLSAVSSRLLGTVLRMIPPRKLEGSGYASYYRTDAVTDLRTKNSDGSPSFVDDPTVTTPNSLARQRPTPSPRR